MNYVIISGGELYHHGVKGMHWGIRRYQNADGSLTPAGAKHYGDGGVGTKKATRKAKTEMTDEERAARNAKIKKAAVAVGVTALVAAGTYAAVKYNKKTMGEAKQIMSDVHMDKMNKLLDKASKQAEKEQFARSMYDKFESAGEHNTTAGQYWMSEIQAAKKGFTDAVKERNAYDTRATTAMRDKTVLRKAQKEIIKRDLKDTKAKAYSKYREAKGDLPQNVGWYMDRTNKKATKNIANLLNETANRRSKK